MSDMNDETWKNFEQKILDVFPTCTITSIDSGDGPAFVMVKASTNAYAKTIKDTLEQGSVGDHTGKMAALEEARMAVGEPYIMTNYDDAAPSELPMLAPSQTYVGAAATELAA